MVQKLFKKTASKLQNKLTKRKKEAVRYGIDIEMLQKNLTLSFEERLIQHESALQLVEEIIKTKIVKKGGVALSKV
ncbi:MAG TPA: hypothetical protein VJB34_06490 [Bdellovibrionota bacterium]|nr:hypothetical protein [Bdellovibrionota bacterium]